MKNKITIIAGTTASGKTAYSIELAKKIHGEVINCDSMQIYKDIPILSAQPNMKERNDIPHHLFSIIGLNDKFSVGHWLKLAIKKIEEIKDRKKTPIIVGGTGLYIKALIEGITETPQISDEVKNKVSELASPYEALQKADPVTAEKLNPSDLIRIKRALEVFHETGKPISELHQKPVNHIFSRTDFHLIQIHRDREIIYDNINKRFLDMIENGSIEECKKAYELYGDINYPKAHGLPEIIKYLNHEIFYDEMVSKSQQNVRNYAKRQLTFFRHQFTFDDVINL